MFTVVDLFAGAGGLSYGFERTGKVKIVAAAEKNPNARKTYLRNHPSVDFVYEDVHDIDYSELQRKLGSIDIVIGGPPCQGFSNCNRQHTTLISMNNRLVKEYVRCICELRPRAFLMENVAMLRSQVHRFIVDEDDVMNPDVMMLEMQSDKMELLPSEAFFDGALEIAQTFSINNYKSWSEKRLMVYNNLFRYRINKTKFDRTLQKYKAYLAEDSLQFLKQDTMNILTSAEYHLAKILQEYMDGNESVFDALIDAIKTPLYAQKMIEKLHEIHDYNIHVYGYEIDNGAVIACVKSYAVLDYIKGILGYKLHYQITSQVYNALDYGAPQRRQRFIIVGLSESIQSKFELPTPEYIFEPRTVRDAISDIEDVPPTVEVTSEGIPLMHKDNLSELAKELRGSILYNHICTDSREAAQQRFAALKAGQNFHDLDPSLKATYSNAERTQNTIYLRLAYDLPCPTVVNVRKSMWVHPTQNRAVSIREAARLQTFPDHYVFEGTKDSQYQQVGNAVPPVLATAVAKQLLKAIE